MAITPNGPHSNNGGARLNAGAKKDQHRIACGELRKALEAKLGMPYVEMLAETQVKLFNDSKMDKNVKEFLTFTENMSRRILQEQRAEIEVSTISELSKEELEAYRNNLLTRLVLSSKPDVKDKE
jgi:hypothetical protein